MSQVTWRDTIAGLEVEMHGIEVVVKDVPSTLYYVDYDEDDPFDGSTDKRGVIRDVYMSADENTFEIQVEVETMDDRGDEELSIGIRIPREIMEVVMAANAEWEKAQLT